MLKLNKCRTLFQFNEAILASMQTQNQSSGTPAQEKAEQSVPTNQDKAIDGGSIDQKPENQNEKEISSEETKQVEKEHKEEKKENENKEKSQNSQEIQGQTQQTENQTQYLFFEPDEFIITTFMYENGWWYGYKDLGETTPSQQNMGYFPSNYVQVIEEYEQQSYVDLQGEALKENADLDEAFTWDDYAKHSYLDDTKILVEERTRKLHDWRAPENRNQDGILGYKKIKIHESRSHAVNPSKGGKVTTSQIAIKDQSPAAKAYRQMHHYFDYDAWIDERNKNPAPKAKADPTKKKKKPKVLNW